MRVASYLECPVRIPIFADGTRQEASAGFISLSPRILHPHSRNPTTIGAQVQYRQTHEDGIPEGDVQ